MQSKLFGGIFLLLTLFIFTGATPIKPSAASETTVQWLTFEEAVAKSKTQPRKLFIDVYTDWCGWCKVMDNKTFSNPKIAEVLNTQYYPVKLNAEQRADIPFDGNTFKFVAQGSRGYHELAAALLSGQLSYPTVVIFWDKGAQWNATPIPGFREAVDLMPYLQYYGGGFEQSLEYEEFMKIYQSPF